MGGEAVGKSVRLGERLAGVVGGRVGTGIAGWGGGKIPVEGSGAVEEFEEEGSRGLTVDFSAGASLHSHCCCYCCCYCCQRWEWNGMEAFSYVSPRHCGLLRVWGGSYRYQWGFLLALQPYLR